MSDAKTSRHVLRIVSDMRNQSPQPVCERGGADNPVRACLLFTIVGSMILPVSGLEGDQCRVCVMGWSADKRGAPLKLSAMKITGRLLH